MGRSELGRGQGTFKNILAALKETGCQILVTGDVKEDILSHKSTQLLGEPGHKPARKRLYCIDGRHPNVANTRHPAPTTVHEDPAAAIVSGPGTDRSTTTATVQPSSPAEPLTTNATTTSSFATDIEAAAQSLIGDPATVSASELRVCVDNLDAIPADKHRPFLDQLRATVVEPYQAMVHVVYTDAHDAPNVQSLLEAFDLIFEFRLVDSGVQQRIRAPADDYRTSWWSR